jgi:hypothetical protein
MRSVHLGFAQSLAWHLAPFRRDHLPASPATVDLLVENGEDGDAGEGTPEYSLYIGDEFHGRQTEAGIAGLLAEAVWGIHAAVPNSVGDFLFVHAGAVTRDGGALLLPAPMESGKSSLVMALLQRGFRYLSDEYGALDPVTSRAYPFEKRIAVEPDTLSLFPGLGDLLEDRRVPPISLTKRYARPEDLGSGPAAPTDVRFLVFPTSAWEGPPRLTPIGRAEAVERLSSNALNLQPYRERGVVLLSRIAGGAESFRLDGGTPQQRADLMAGQLS